MALFHSKADERGRCLRHSWIELQRLSPRTHRWVRLLDSCPLCGRENVLRGDILADDSSSIVSVLTQDEIEEEEEREESLASFALRPPSPVTSLPPPPPPPPRPPPRFRIETAASTPHFSAASPSFEAATSCGDNGKGHGDEKDETISSTDPVHVDGPPIRSTSCGSAKASRLFPPPPPPPRRSHSPGSRRRSSLDSGRAKSSRRSPPRRPITFPPPPPRRGRPSTLVPTRTPRQQPIPPPRRRNTRRGKREGGSNCGAQSDFVGENAVAADLPPRLSPRRTLKPEIAERSKGCGSEGLLLESAPLRGNGSTPVDPLHCGPCSPAYPPPPPKTLKGSFGEEPRAPTEQHCSRTPLCSASPASQGPSVKMNDPTEERAREERPEHDRDASRGPHINHAIDAILRSFGQEDCDCDCDLKGRCVRHPTNRLRKKKPFGGWRALMEACPDCCVEELRKVRLGPNNVIMGTGDSKGHNSEGRLGQYEANGDIKSFPGDNAGTNEDDTAGVSTGPQSCTQKQKRKQKQKQYSPKTDKRSPPKSHSSCIRRTIIENASKAPLSSLVHSSPHDADTPQQAIDASMSDGTAITCSTTDTGRSDPARVSRRDTCRFGYRPDMYLQVLATRAFSTTESQVYKC